MSADEAEPKFKQCKVERYLFDHGDKFTHEDGCNSCECKDGVMKCSETKCPTPEKTKGCELENFVIAISFSFDSANGCNRCHYSSKETILCTYRYCP